MALLTIPEHSIYDGTIHQNRIQRIPNCEGVRVRLVAGTYREKLTIENLAAQEAVLWLSHSMWPEFRLPGQTYWSALGGVSGTSHSIHLATYDGTPDFTGLSALVMDRTVRLGDPGDEYGVEWTSSGLEVVFREPAVLAAMSGSGPARLFARLAHGTSVEPWIQKWQLRAAKGNTPISVAPAIGHPHEITMGAQFEVVLE